MQVLVIGYGKIGRIKASLWQSLGASVYVHDVSNAVLQKAVVDGFKTVDQCSASEDLTLDISTPAGQHFSSLEWGVQASVSPIHQILIEKPLASSPVELKKFKKLGMSTRSKIVLNESYFSSIGLRKLAATVDTTPQHIAIELSKNRLQDITNGRFFDYELGALGIETPHMIAILQMLNVAVDQASISKAILHVDSNRVENQGFEISLQSNGTDVVLRSFLGDFSFSSTGEMKSNKTIRNIMVRTQSQNITLEFDPARDLPRYHSRLTIQEIDNNQVTTEFADDHLRKHMAQLQNKDPVNSFLGFDNAAYLSDTLSKLRGSFKIDRIPDHTIETITQEGL